MGTVRAFLLTGDESLSGSDPATAAERSSTNWSRLSTLVSTPEEIEALDEIEQDATAQFDAGDKVVEMRQTEDDLPAIGKAFQDQVVPLFEVAAGASGGFRRAWKRRTSRPPRHVGHPTRPRSPSSWSSPSPASVAGGRAPGCVLLTRMLSRQIGSAVQHIQSSSSELQAAANQQTAGAKEQVASMTEISTTIKELMSTAKQIADSAQGVARIADSTTGRGPGRRRDRPASRRTRSRRSASRWT